MRHQNEMQLCSGPYLPKALLIAIGLALAGHGSSLAQDQPLRLQGLFCNTEWQLDSALAHMSQGQTPRAAAELVNKSEGVCNHIDLLHYVVEHPEEIWQNKVAVDATKYKGTLSGVVVGGQVRSISPPIEIFFAVPERIASAYVERPT